MQSRLCVARAKIAHFVVESGLGEDGRYIQLKVGAIHTSLNDLVAR